MTSSGLMQSATLRPCATIHQRGPPPGFILDAQSRALAHVSGRLKKCLMFMTKQLQLRLVTQLRSKMTTAVRHIENKYSI